MIEEAWNQQGKVLIRIFAVLSGDHTIVVMYRKIQESIQ
jgi:hypothetical protein